MSAKTSCPRRTERDANAQLARSLGDDVGENAVQANDRQDERCRGEAGQQPRRESLARCGRLDDVRHRTHVGERDIPVERRDGGAQGRDQRARVSGRAKDDVHVAATESARLMNREVEHIGRCDIESERAHVSDDANDLADERVLAEIDDEPLAHRVLVPKQSRRHPATQHDRVWACAIVAPEHSAAGERDAHRLEVVVTDDVDLRVARGLGRLRVSFDPIARVSSAAKRKHRRHRGQRRAGIREAPSLSDCQKRS